MKLLIFTQAVDREDTVLSFFHHWIEELAPLVESIHVVCLKEGLHNLPVNVTVHSLGKETGASRMKYVTRFYRYLWTLRHEYDAVFAHMNEEYILMGGLLWRLFGKRVYLWRNFHSGAWTTDVAAFFCTKVFCTSKSSYTARYKKTVLMPVGIDTEVFKEKKEVTRMPGSILSLGRIAPEKRIETLIDALIILTKRGVSFKAHIYGNALPHDEPYRDALIARVQESGLTETIQFHPGVPNDETPHIFGTHEVFVNLSPSGMYDKTIFEAAASGCFSVASSLDYAEHADPRCVFPEENAEVLAERIETLLALTPEDKETLKQSLRLLAVKDHSLDALVHALCRELH